MTFCTLPGICKRVYLTCMWKGWAILFPIYKYACIFISLPCPSLSPKTKGITVLFSLSVGCYAKFSSLKKMYFFSLYQHTPGKAQVLGYFPFDWKTTHKYFMSVTLPFIHYLMWHVYTLYIPVQEIICNYSYSGLLLTILLFSWH